MRFQPNTRVTHLARPGWGEGTVLRCSPFLGGDGRHWVLVDFGWSRFHAEAHDLVEVETVVTEEA